MTTLYLSHLTDTPLGDIVCVMTDVGLLAVEIGPEDPFAWAASAARRLFPGSTFESLTPSSAADQILEYLNGNRRAFDLPLDWRLTTPFQKRVLEVVASVPYGETRTYRWIAGRIGQPGAARAVGRANAANPITLILPCHRVVGEDGSLRGYRAPGGTAAKAWLLALERGELARV